MSRPSRVVVIAVGNEFRRDDGIGPVVLAELAKRDLPPDVTLALSDGEPTQLFEAWSGRALAVVVDAVRCEPSEPGRIHRTTLTGGSLVSGAASTHGLGIPDAVGLADVLDRAPQELVVYAIEVLDLGFGVGLSDPVARAVPDVVHAIVAELATEPSKR